MYVQDDYTVLNDYGEYVSVIPNYLLDMEGNNSTDEEVRETDTLSESGSEEEKSGESEDIHGSSGGNETGEDSSIDYSSTLTSIDGRLENVELLLTDIENNQSDLIDSSQNIELVLGSGIALFIVFIVGLVAFKIISWLNKII